jgi:DNA-binding NarL/FixJ family response regulator
MENRTNRILFAEDHSIVVTGMKIIFQIHFPQWELEVVAKTTDLMDALKKNSYLMAIIDLQLEDGETYHLIADILRMYPKLNTLIFSTNPDEIYARKLYQVGIKGYLNKTTSDEEMVESIRQVAKGNLFISHRFRNYMSTIKPAKNLNPIENLSHREMEILSLIMKGRKTSEISHDLNLQLSTVSTFKSRIFTKLKVDNIIELTQVMRIYNEDSYSRSVSYSVK